MLSDRQHVTPYFITRLKANGKPVCLGTMCSLQFGWVELDRDLLVETNFVQC